MIRQAISCDICGAEKKQTNHWFVAYEQAGELRVSGWSSRNRLRTGSKHLCGQACLHKLADDFMARVISAKGAARAAVVEELELEAPAATDESLTCSAELELESSARLLPPAPAMPKTAARSGAGLVTMIERHPDASLAPAEEPPRFASRNWRAEAWERERERASRCSDRRPEIISRRISQA